jgi:hypothetical protein
MTALPFSNPVPGAITFNVPRTSFANPVNVNSHR